MTKIFCCCLNGGLWNWVSVSFRSLQHLPSELTHIHSPDLPSLHPSLDSRHTSFTLHTLYPMPLTQPHPQRDSEHYVYLGFGNRRLNVTAAPAELNHRGKACCVCKIIIPSEKPLPSNLFISNRDFEYPNRYLCDKKFVKPKCVLPGLFWETTTPSFWKSPCSAGGSNTTCCLYPNMDMMQDLTRAQPKWDLWGWCR